MISKERLQDLINQGATIYYVVNNEICSLELTFRHNIYLAVEGCFICLYGYKGLQIYDNRIFETKEDAEKFLWQEEFGCIEKLQYLKFPNWKQIENHIEYMRKFGLNHNDRVLARIITSNSIFYFKLCKNLDLFTFELKQTYIGDDLCEQIRDKFPISLGKATKGNYTIACRKAKQLFLGESNEEKKHK